MNNKPLTLAVDMYGCPNRCLHCWLSHMPNRTMEPDADRWIVDLFRPYFARIAFYSWLREPDFCDDYRARWERDKALSVGALPQRFELGSFRRLARDPDYAAFLKETGVKCVQLTFFGLEEMTDRYVGRKGAYRELLQATEILLAHEISPRWQTFINEENEQLRFGHGYDHNWCLDGEGMRTACKVQDPVSGRTIEVITDQPGLQFYSGNFFDGGEAGKNGKPLGFRSSLVLEAQGWPDAVNHPEFPSIVILPEQTYRSATIYRFGTKH